MAPSQRALKAFQRIDEKRCKNVDFSELCTLLELYGWKLERVAKDNHYIYVHDAYEGVVNLARPHHGQDVKSVYCRAALKAISEVEELNEWES